MANNPFLCLVWALGDAPPGIWGGGNMPYPDQGLPGSQPRPDQGLPGQGGRPSHPIHYPPYPDQGLPGGQGGHPSQPIYHPGHPDHGLPAFPSHPIELPPGGTPIDPPTEIPPPAGHEDEVVVGVYKPNQGWEFKSYDVAPDQGQPTPTPHQ